MGELYAEDRELVPMEEEAASADFMSQLREYCQPFRFDPGKVVHKSF